MLDRSLLSFSSNLSLESNRVRSHHVEEQGSAGAADNLEQRLGHPSRSQRDDPGDPGGAEAGEHHDHEESRGRVSKDRSTAVRQLGGGQRRLLELRDTVQHEGGKSPDGHGQDGPRLRSHGGRIAQAQGARCQGTEDRRRLCSAASKSIFLIYSDSSR